MPANAIYEYDVILTEHCVRIEQTDQGFRITIRDSSDGPDLALVDIGYDEAMRLGSFLLCAAKHKSELGHLIERVVEA